MKQKPTVLIVENSIDTTGAFKAIFNYVKYAEGSFNFIFVFPKGSRLVYTVSEEGFLAYEIPFVEIGKSFNKLLLYFPYLIINSVRLLKLVSVHKIDLVHVNDFYNLVGAIGKLLGGKYQLLTHIRFMPDRFPSSLVKIWYVFGIRYSNSLICVSNAVQKLLPDHPKQKVIYDTIPAILEENVFIKNDRRDEQIRLLYLGHYIPGKGQDYALEAFNRAYQKDNRLRLKFVGGDMGLKKNQIYKQRLINRAKKLGLEKYVEFGGPTSDTKSEYLTCDIALNFSESESFSFTCLEALALGIPLITSDCGGPAELVEHGKSGLLVQNREINKMSKAIVELTVNSTLRNTLSSHGMSFVLRKLSVENTYAELKRTYDEVLTCSGK